MSDLDTELIQALQRDGRASIGDLAHLLGRPRAAVSTRLHALLGDGTVRVVAAVDPGLLGQHVLAHVSVRARSSVEEIAAALSDRDETVLVSATGGNHDLITEVRVATTAELRHVVSRIRAIPGVVGTSTLIYDSVLTGFFVSTYSGTTSIDEIDTALIERLQEDGRCSYRALGRHVRLSPSAVAARVRRLHESGVIKISAVEARGIVRRQMWLGVGLTLTTDTAVIGALTTWPCVDFAARTIGRFDIIATLVEPTMGAIFTDLELLRKLPGVASIESWVHLRVLKEDYTRRIRVIPE